MFDRWGWDAWGPSMMLPPKPMVQTLLVVGACAPHTKEVSRGSGGLGGPGRPVPTEDGVKAIVHAVERSSIKATCT